MSPIRIIFGMSVIGALASTAGAQPADPSDFPGNTPMPELANVFEEMGPADLPGRERGDRDRAPAAPAPDRTPAAEEASFWTQARLTGDWWGARTKLEDSGITFNASFTYHFSSVVTGGIKQGGSGRHLWDINASFDLDKLAGWSGATVFADFQSSDDKGRINDAGVFQLPGVIDYNRNIDEVGELWLQQKLADDVVRLKVGKIDANNEFAFVNATADFLNGSTNFSPTVLQLPTVPAQATGVVAFIYPTEKFYVGAGFFDGATQDGIRTGGRGPADFFSDARSTSWYWIGEAGISWTCEAMGDGRAAAGVWHATGEFARWDGDIEEGTEGAYALIEQQLWRRGDTDEHRCKGLFAFAQYGWADKDVASIGQHIAAGLTLKGTCRSRHSDSVGFYWSVADVSKDVLTGANRDEHAFEVYYKAQLTPWVYVQPNVQWYINPSGRAGIDDPVVLGVQVGVVF